MDYDIGINRKIEVGIHESQWLLVICRHFTEAELDINQRSFPYATICLPKHNVQKIISLKDSLQSSLGEVCISLPMENRKFELGNNLFATMDTNSHTAKGGDSGRVLKAWHLRRPVSPSPWDDESSQHNWGQIRSIDGNVCWDQCFYAFFCCLWPLHTS